MIYIKFIHTLLGLFTLLLFAALALVPSKLLPASVLVLHNESDTLLLLATTVANLSLGLYIISGHGIKRKVQLFASTLIISSAFLAVYTVFNPTYTLYSVTLQHIVQLLLVFGVIMHFLINLNTLNFLVSPRIVDDGSEAGTVKWFNISKGFGFITRDIGGDVFVHYRAIKGAGHRALQEGQRVDFTVIESNKGLQAEDVIVTARR